MMNHQQHKTTEQTAVDRLKQLLSFSKSIKDEALFMKTAEQLRKHTGLNIIGTYAELAPERQCTGFDWRKSGLLMICERNRIIQASARGFYELTGWRLYEVMEEPFKFYSDVEGRQRVLAEADRNGEVTVTCDWQHKAGHEFPVRVLVRKDTIRRHEQTYRVLVKPV